MSPDVKPYEAEGFYLEFSPNGSAYAGTLRTTDEGGRGPYEAELTLTKTGSREKYARKAAELYEMDRGRLERALNEVCTRRSEEVAAAEKAAEDEAEEYHEASDISPERRAEAMRLLESPDLLEEAAVDMERLGHVGEVATKKLALICALSARSGRPIQPSTHAQSSAGKNALWDAVLALLPEEMIVRRSGLTAKALFRTEADLKGAVLYLQEVAGSEDANYSIRAMQSDGRLEYEATEKAPDGSLRNVVYCTEGPTVIVQTTTKNHLHPENETRVFPIYIDESEEQTGRIVEGILKDAAGHGVDGTERDRVRERWHDAVRLLEPEMEVVLPYAERIEVPTSPIRVRRDARRLIDVVRVIAWLHQHQRARDDEGRILATEDDFREALTLVRESLRRAWQTITPAEEKVLEAIRGLPELKRTRNGFKRRELDVKEVSDRRVKEVLKSLTDTGYLESDGKGGPQGHTYTLARDAKEISLGISLRPPPDRGETAANDENPNGRGASARYHPMPDGEASADGRREAGTNGRGDHRPKETADLQGKSATGRTGGEGGQDFPDNGPNGRRSTSEQENRVRRLVDEGTSEKWARRTVLAGDHPLDCDCEVCM